MPKLADELANWLLETKFEKVAKGPLDDFVKMVNIINRKDKTGRRLT